MLKGMDGLTSAVENVMAPDTRLNMIESRRILGLCLPMIRSAGIV